MGRAADAEGPEAVEEVLEALVGSRQVGFELSVVHIVVIRFSATERHTQ
jgi:hypothetical protein